MTAIVRMFDADWNEHSRSFSGDACRRSDESLARTALRELPKDFHPVDIRVVREATVELDEVLWAKSACRECGRGGAA